MPQSATKSIRTRRSIAIIGAGIVGMSAAHFLSQAGWRAIVFDTGGPASGATGASDGAVSVASKKPGPLMTLAVAAVRFYEQLVRSGVLLDEYASRSTFVVASDAEELTVLEQHAAGLREAGVPTRYLRDSALTDTLGAMAPTALAALEVQREGHAIGYRVVERLRRLGGFEIQRGRHVVAIRRTGSRVESVMTDDGAVPVDAVLLAAGLGSAGFLDAPQLIRPRKGQLIVTDRAGGDMPRLPGPLMSCRYLVSKGSQPGGRSVEKRSLGLVIDPLTTGQFLIGGSREDSSDKHGVDSLVVARLLADAVALSPRLAELRIIRVFAGLRAATADGLPIVGRMGGADNAWIATGFEGDGICLGPLMGRICQQLICGEQPEQDVSSLDAQRFELGLAA